MINETISEAQGLLCVHTKVECPQYDSDPAAWTPALFQWIEDAGLVEAMCERLLMPEGFGKACITLDPDFDSWIWKGLSATPLQKAQALARAIEEGV